jgi:hypothetical protein
MNTFEETRHHIAQLTASAQEVVDRFRRARRVIAPKPRYCIREEYHEFTYSPFEIIDNAAVLVSGPDILAKQWEFWYSDGDIEKVVMREPVSAD